MAKLIWVKKNISKTDWNEKCAPLGTFTMLHANDPMVMVAFAVGEEMPPSCELCTPDDLWRIYNSRKRSNQYPLPYIEDKQKVIDEEIEMVESRKGWDSLRTMLESAGYIKGKPKWKTKKESKYH